MQCSNFPPCDQQLQQFLCITSVCRLLGLQNSTGHFSLSLATLPPQSSKISFAVRTWAYLKPQDLNFIPNKFVSFLINSTRETTATMAINQASALNSPLEKQGTRLCLCFFFKGQKKSPRKWNARRFRNGTDKIRTSVAFPLILEVAVNNQTTPWAPKKATQNNPITSWSVFSSKKCW